MEKWFLFEEQIDISPEITLNVLIISTTQKKPCNRIANALGPLPLWLRQSQRQTPQGKEEI